MASSSLAPHFSGGVYISAISRQLINKRLGKLRDHAFRFLQQLIGVIKAQPEMTDLQGLHRRDLQVMPPGYIRV